MSMLFKTIIGAAMATAALGATDALAYPSLPNLPNNLNFQNYTGSAPKGSFTSVAPVGWTGGGGLIFVDSQTPGQDAAGPVYLQTYGDPSGSVPGNYVEADGNPTFESGFNYTVTGLTKGQTYTLSFYQGASSQVGYGFNPYVGKNTGTTNQWIVALGTPGSTLVTHGGGPVDPLFGPTDTYSDTDPTASIAASQLMNVPYQGTVGWNFVSVNITADASTDVLSFLAWGDDGSTINLPPIAFLAGVDNAPGLGVPEPASFALIGAGLIGLGFYAKRRRAG